MMRTQDDVTRDILNKIRVIQESKSNTTTLKLLNEEVETSNDIMAQIEELQSQIDTLKSKIDDEDADMDSDTEAIAITDEPKFAQNALTNQIQQFRSSVESGAQFAKVDNSNVSECPLIYMPSTGNLVFSGVIPCLNNLKWQFVLKTSTGNGCFVWADGLILNKDNMQILNKLFGFYQNWREQWNSESADLERMVQNMQNK